MSNTQDMHGDEERRQDDEHRRRVAAGRRASEYGSESDEPREELIDTLANLMHYAGTDGLDFDDALRVARDHHANEVPSFRGRRYATLCDYYLAEPDDGDAPLRYAACSKDRDDELAASGRVTTWATVDEAFADLGDQVLDGECVDAVYDLDTGERIGIHVSTPIVTRSEDQGVMINPLRPETQTTPHSGVGD
jgi:hypothetical protein